MKYKLLFFVFQSLYFASFSTFSQTKISKADFEKDVSIAIKNLEKHHLGLYYYQSKSDFEIQRMHCLSNVPDSLSKLDAQMRISTLVSSIKDLHTSVFVTKPPKPIKSLPLSFKRFDNRFYINYNLSIDSTVQLGDEILEIDQEPIVEVFQKLTNFYGPDNGNPVSKFYYAERSFAPFYRYYRGQRDSISLKMRSFKSDSLYNLTIKTQEAKVSNQILAKRNKKAIRTNLKYTVIDSLSKTAMLDVSSFTMKGSKFDIFQLKFKRVVRKHFKAIKKQGIEHLVVDFRGNGGGNISNISSLTKYVAQSRFRMMDSIYLSEATFKRSFPAYLPFSYVFGKLYYKRNAEGLYYHSNPRGFKKPSKNLNYKGKIYVMMDGGSYSATAFTIGLWHDMNRATFFGTAPGGANWGSFAAKWKLQKLKNTGLSVRIPMYKIIHAQPNKRTSTFTVVPDFFVGNNKADFLKRKDTQLQFVLNYIKSN